MHESFTQNVTRPEAEEDKNLSRKASVGTGWSDLSSVGRQILPLASASAAMAVVVSFCVFAPRRAGIAAPAILLSLGVGSGIVAYVMLLFWTRPPALALVGELLIKTGVPVLCRVGSRVIAPGQE